MTSLSPTPPPPSLRVGWCPGVLRPMRVGDGLLARVKPRGYGLTLAQAEVVADAARRWGNGALNITARGNLQVRGLAEAGLPAFTQALAAAGLLDEAPEGEAVRNVVSSPLAGADPTALLDARALVVAWEEQLASDPALWRLPAKFSWSVDEGGAVPLGGIATDVAFSAVTALDGLRLSIRLDGDADVSATCRPDDMVMAGTAIAAAFLALCAEAGMAPHRMREGVRTWGAAAILRRAGLGAVTVQPVQPIAAPDLVGVHRLGLRSFVGATPAFGLLGAGTLASFVTAARAAGAGAIRLTPWRGLLVAGLLAEAAESVAGRLAGSGLILDAADPRLKVAACVGQPGCARATTPVPADAARLAALIGPAAPPGIRLHVSGCAKGCAHGGTAPVTLVGRASGYDLVRHGRAGDPPAAHALPLAAIAPMLPPLLEPRA